jgi:hypothetical protein
MKNYILTQKLYPLEEVILALLTALLKKENIKECHYWLKEISLSLGELETRIVIGQIYYDFYYPLNPAEEMNALSLKCLVERLFRVKSSPEVFILCQARIQKPNFIYINKKTAKWLVPIKDERMHDLIRAVNKSHYDGVCYQVNKLLAVNGIVGEDLVRALCIYYETGFISKTPFMRDDLQYVMTVYVKLLIAEPYDDEQEQEMADDNEDTDGNEGSDWNEGSDTDWNEGVLPIISAFKLQRWQQQADLNTNEIDERLRLIERLVHDPLLIAFGLSLKGNNNLSDIFLAGFNYIKSQLNEDEVKLFTGMHQQEDLELCETDYEEMFAEQQLKHRGWIENYKEQIPDIRLAEMVPTLGTKWLKEVFPEANEKIAALIEYKMFDIIY